MALTYCLAAERATSSEVRRWVDEATEEGRGHVKERVGRLASARQQLTDAVEQDRAQAAEVAGDYTPKQLQVSTIRYLITGQHMQ